MNRCPRCCSQASSEGCSHCGYVPAVIDGFIAYAPELALQAPGYDPEHYHHLAILEAGNFWFKARNRLILWLFGKHFPEARNYLEIGCGTGYVLSAISKSFPNLKSHGSEIFVEGLAIAAQRAPKAFVFQMDARQLPFANAYDVIGAFDVIEHIQDDMCVLGQLGQALRSGGGLILTVPQHPWLWSAQDDFAHHVRRYRVGELEGKLAESGFVVRWSSSFVSLLLPVLALSRLARRKKAGPECDPFAEFKLPRWLNACLLGIMRTEIALLKAGIRFPAGGSRVIVAYKEHA